jgi:hypothetical protein
MANTIAGDFIEITYNHPTLGAGRFAPKANESFTLDKGGFRTADDASMIDGSGAPINQLNRVRWSAEGPVAWDNGADPDAADRLVSLAGNPVDADWTFTHVSGKIYAGKGRPVGDIQADSNAGTISMKISGGGTLQVI